MPMVRGERAMNNYLSFNYYCEDCDDHLTKKDMEAHIEAEPEHNIISLEIGAD